MFKHHSGFSSRLLNVAFFALLALACSGCGKSVAPTPTATTLDDPSLSQFPGGVAVQTPVPTTTPGTGVVIVPTPTPSPTPPVGQATPTPTPGTGVPGYIFAGGTGGGGQATQGTIPLPDPCRGISGLYGGVCNSSAGSRQIQFIVAATQNGQCVVVNSTFFQDEILLFGSTSAQAPLKGYPGGVAVSSTSINISAPGVFKIKGYNYAGNFWFTCN